MSEHQTPRPGELEHRPAALAPVFGGSGLEYVEIDPNSIDFEVLGLLDQETAVSRQVVAIAASGNQVTVAVADPWNLMVLDDLRVRLLPRQIDFVHADPAQIAAAQRRWAQRDAKAAESEAVRDLAGDIGDSEVAEATDDSGRMAQLVANLLEQAMIAGASDIHVEPREEHVEVRFRLDGVLSTHTRYPIGLANGIVNRIKVMARMDLAERRRPLDGRFNRRIAGREVDCRVVSLPTAGGNEGAVIRLLDQSRTQLSLAEVGFHPEVSNCFLSVLENPYGMVLVTGPTGSGKTTTLYASLGEVARPDRKILTIEDPVEIRFPSTTQLQVNDRSGLTFSSALRAFLRADPDVILVGEIRDAETAALAAQAALTGHLVLSTLHTNEAAGAPTRLGNMGLEGFIIASALKGVLSQRLLRRLCDRCRIPREASDEVLTNLGWDMSGIDRPDMLWEPGPGGCDHCNHRGYRGRVVAAEFLSLDENLAAAVVAHASSGELEAMAHAAGMVPMHIDALRWLASGDTSVDEIRRVGV